MSISAITRLRRIISRVPLPSAMPMLKKFVSYDEASRLVRTAEIKSIAEFKQWNQRHDSGVPSNPNFTYRGKGWTTWFAFFGTQSNHTTSDWNAIAKQLARENGGVLPNTAWLKNNGHMGLYHAMRRHPEQFRRIRQGKRKLNSVEEHVATAKRLARENGGVLPNAMWLRAHGHRGLQAATYKFPEKFRCFRQEKMHKSIDEQVAIAKRLSREHGGVLPNTWWLQRNGYVGLDTMMRKYPDAFRGISQKQLQVSVTRAMSYRLAALLVRRAGITIRQQFKKWTRPTGMPSHPEKTYAGKGWRGWRSFLRP